jgi:putative cell wall-binding protein
MRPRRRTLLLTAFIALLSLAAPLPAAQATSGMGVISGFVYDGDSSPQVTRAATVFLLRVGDPEDVYRATAATAATGYSFSDVEPGDYKVCFGIGETPEVIQYCYYGEYAPQWAHTVQVAPDSNVTGIDGEIRATGSLEGSVFGALTSESPILPLGDVNIWVAEGGGGLGYSAVRSATTDPGTNTWRVDYLPWGTYFVNFSHPRYLSKFWGESPTPPWAPMAIEVYPGGVTTLDSMVLSGRNMTNVTTHRITGSDRFGTGVAVSKEMFPTVPAEGVPVVYIANGLNFPDALAAGPAAIENGGVVLLVYPWAIPEIVKSELLRLNPQRIVVTGGIPSVDANVYEDLAQYVDNPDDNLDRLTGTDRFGTSREIARDTFRSGASAAFIATGMNYPDALAAGPAAGELDAPVILVNGGAAHVDAETVLLLSELGVEEVFIIGGGPSVSAGIENDLKAVPGLSVSRITGSDRFGTSVAIAQHFFAYADSVYLATGMNFPDALAGGPLAASLGAPLYLSRQQCLSADVAEDILEVGAWSVSLLGGPPSLSDNVIYLRC